MSEAPIQPITVTFHCNVCGGKRNHAVLTEHVHEWDEEVSYEDDEGPGIFYVHQKEVYLLLRCCGCDSVSLKHESFSEAEEHPAIKIYPPRQFRQPPRWLYELDYFAAFRNADIAFIPRLLREIYGSLYSEHRAVSAMGIRALLELVMVEKIGDRGSFGKNVEAFQTEGFISLQQRTLLDSVLEFGHASMHRNYAPATKELISALDVAENLIHTLYILPDEAKSLSDAIPKRKRTA
jgi:hypothetical protein